MKIYKKLLTITLFILVISISSGCKKNEETSTNTNNDFIELSQDVIEKNKIETVTVEEKPVSTTITTTGEIKTDEEKFYTINSMVTGRIISSKVKLGDFIHSGQTVAQIQNPEITRINAEATSSLHENKIAIRQAKTRFNQSKTNYEREKKLYAEGISPQKDLIQAKTEFLLAQDDLVNCQERDTHIRQEAKALMGTYGVHPNFNSENLATTTPLIAMKSGIITKKNVTLGSIVTPEQILFEVTDMSRLWLDITLYSTDITHIEKGQKVMFKPDSYNGKIFIGKIDYIQPLSDEPTQTFLARAYIDNGLGLLRPGMFGETKIINNIKENKPFVPETAVQKYGKETFVFLNLGNGKFKKQIIELGEKNETGYFVNNGINKGDKIVANGSFTLKSELLKSEFAEED